jgi:hypothetical protein
MIILVGANLFVQRLYSLFYKVYPEMVERFRLVPTLEEAYAFLASAPIKSSTNDLHPKPM